MTRLDHVNAGMTADQLRSFYLRYIDLANSRDFDRMDEFAHDEVIMNGTPVARDDMVAEFRRHLDRFLTSRGRSRTSSSMVIA